MGVGYNDARIASAIVYETVDYLTIVVMLNVARIASAIVYETVDYLTIVVFNCARIVSAIV